MATWQVQEAKTKLSELIEQARSEGPQTITKHGKPAAVVLSVAEFESMRRQVPNLVDYLRSGPSLEGVDLDRSKDTGRTVDL